MNERRPGNWYIVQELAERFAQLRPDGNEHGHGHPLR